jgi:hypothetical protein
MAEAQRVDTMVALLVYAQTVVAVLVDAAPGLRLVSGPDEHLALSLPLQALIAY